MSFEAGSRLGPYEIVAPLGAGGMGQVFRARDTRLDRTVAIKVLAGSLAAHPESRRRFEEEARTIAALNDPHICTIHDVGREGDLDYLVLEYLEGESLADRLKRAPALTIDETLAIAVQIGDALDRAHRAGIVHRDLKPGNVMLVRRPGATAPDVKLLDFGLAAFTTPERPRQADVALAETMAGTMVATRPPTASSASGSSSAFTGTIQYMAPEQLDGKEGDQRADIFAFGCVLYEMLAGRKAFAGSTAVTVIAAIMSSEPPAVEALQSNPLLDHAMRRCLDKNLDSRWQSISDANGELRWIAAHPALFAAPVTQPVAPIPNRRLQMVALAAALVVAAALAAFAVRELRGGAESAALPALRLEITTPPTDEGSVALSPDGTQVAFIAHKDRVPMLWVRGLDQIENRVLPGTEGATYPFWSPDGKSVGFFAENKLKQIDVSGGTPRVITDAPTARGGAWSRDGVILFAPGVSAPIVRVSVRGGTTERVTDIHANIGPSHRFPQFLPDGKRFLFSSALGKAETNGLYVGSLDKTPPVRLLAEDGGARFVPPDKLVAIGRGVLQVYPFDPAAAKVTGDPVVITQGFNDAATNGVFGTSDTGILVYRPASTQRRHLVWVSRQGMPLGDVTDVETTTIGSPELSPDERSVAVFLHPTRGTDNDVWIYEIARKLGRPVTSGPPADAHPVWEPDGQGVVFNSLRPMHRRIGAAAAEPFFAKDLRGTVLSLTRDGRFALLSRTADATATDLVAVSRDAEAREVPIAQSAADETEGQFSPDGQWVAFVSNESGRQEVYVQAFPDARGHVQVSTGGGTQVRWSADGKEIFYIAPDGKLMAVKVGLTGASPEVQLPAALFRTYLASGVNVVGNKPQYAVARDGRFLINEAVEGESQPIVVAINWLKKLAK
jgi:Tol biopolymer transport system component/tRNA A-37 threonylcarbamoyl transferase component Bud32